MIGGHLSPHLEVAEFLRTEHADLADDVEQLWNASPEIRANAVRLAEDVFEPVRAVLGVPLAVGSGLRSPALNERVKGAGSAARPGRPSRHLFGLAVDVVPLEGLDPTGALFMLLHGMRRGELPRVDSVIVEGRGPDRWLHLQAAEDGRPARQLAMSSADGRIFARAT